MSTSESDAVNLFRRITNIRNRANRYKREDKADWSAYAFKQMENLKNHGNEEMPDDVIPAGYPRALAVVAMPKSNSKPKADVKPVRTGPTECNIINTFVVYNEPVIDVEATKAAVNEWLKNPVGAPPTVMTERTINADETTNAIITHYNTLLEAKGISHRLGKIKPKN